MKAKLTSKKTPVKPAYRKSTGMSRIKKAGKTIVKAGINDLHTGVIPVAMKGLTSARTGLTNSSSFKMKGFKGFGDSPLKAKSDAAKNLLKAVPNKEAYNKLSEENRVGFDQAAKKAGLPTKKSSPAKKAKGMDGKACWKGYKLAGTKKKGGKTVDNCVKA